MTEVEKVLVLLDLLKVDKAGESLPHRPVLPEQAWPQI